jgi:hypothetical protein
MYLSESTFGSGTALFNVTPGTKYEHNSENICFASIVIVGGISHLKMILVDIF